MHNKFNEILFKSGSYELRYNRKENIAAIFETIDGLTALIDGAYFCNRPTFKACYSIFRSYCTFKEVMNIYYEV